MARKLRIQYEGALYHIVNRGNYRRDVFESVGAAEAFLSVLFEAASRYQWALQGYVLMRNHFHFVVETPKPNLVEGMHWLQSTIATRFNRFRREQGHLFQGRYHSILLQDYAVVGRVVDYIHLNPVRAGIVPAEQVMNYRWSSLRCFVRGPRPAEMSAAPWLSARGGWTDNADGWAAYLNYLVELGKDEAEQKRQGLEGLSRGWAIGSSGWRQAIARDFSHLKLAGGLGRDESKAMNEANWEALLLQFLTQLKKSRNELATRPKNVPWKIDLAHRLRTEAGASVVWIARALQLGKPGSLRSYLARRQARNNQQTAA